MNIATSFPTAAPPKPLTPELLRQLLRYEPETGKLYWRERDVRFFRDGAKAKEAVCKSWNTKWAGKEAFKFIGGNGYHRGAVFDRPMRAHRVIWALVHGAWPEADIDHINGDRSDNRLCNLRVVTRAENNRNAKRPTDNTSGIPGVYSTRAPGKWFAKIGAGGKRIYLGTYDTFDLAVQAREAALKKHGFHPNHGRES